MSKYNKIFLSIIFYIISVFIYNYYSYINYKQKEIATVDDKLKIGAYAVYNTLGDDFFKVAIDKDSISIKEDWENIKKLTFYNNHANLAFIYSSIKKENNIYLTSSSASAKELEQESQLHYFHYYDDAGDALVESFESKKIVYENYTDKWGSFRAVHIPITLSNKQLIVISSEISLEAYTQILNDIKYKYLLETLFYILISIPIILTVYFYNKEKSLQTLKIEQELMKSENMASLGKMIANIAHQWRQPLSIISTGATGMKVQKESGLLEDKIFYKTCLIINENAQYLSKTIDSFKDFINGERKKVEFNLYDTINSFLSLVDTSIKIDNINIVLDIQENIKINNYPNELTQCLFNIFNNAKEMLNERKIKDKYIFISSTIEKDTIIIKIKDNAKGIEKSILPHIFEPYFTTKHKSIGKGLGLNITYNLILEGMNGRIKAKNITFTHNQNTYTGAIFTIKLPLA